MARRFTFLAGAAVGAAAAYFLDPDGGSKRRSSTREKAVATAKSRGDVAATARQAAGKARGAVHEAARKMPGREAPDDVTLARKVESEIFRPADAPKGAVSVNAENGVVFLRGIVESHDWIDRFEREARDVSGVKEVRNLLHLPGTEAPVAPATR